MSNGYQHSSSNFGLGSGGNMTSMSSQRNTGQMMMPTPGFVNNNTNNNNNNGQSYLSVEASNNSGGFSTAPMMAPQPQQQQQQQQRQNIGGQNSRLLHNLGSQMGVGLRPGMQQIMSNVSNNSTNGGVGMNAKGVDPGTRNSQQVYDNLQRPGMQGKVFVASPFFSSALSAHQNIQFILFSPSGEGYGTNNSDPFGSGNLYGAVTSVGTMTNTQNSSTTSFQSVPRTSSSLVRTDWNSL